VIYILVVTRMVCIVVINLISETSQEVILLEN